MKTKNDDFAPAKKHAAVTTGEAIRMLRELKGWTQEELANGPHPPSPSLWRNKPCMRVPRTSIHPQLFDRYKTLILERLVRHSDLPFLFPGSSPGPALARSFALRLLPNKLRTPPHGALRAVAFSEALAFG